MNLFQNLSQHWCNKGMLKVTNHVMELNGIRRIAMAGPVVRNDEAVASIPTSSTKFQSLANLPQSNPSHFVTNNQARRSLAASKLISLCESWPGKGEVDQCGSEPDFPLRRGWPLHL
jgi:hypothetical protein